MPTIHEIGGRGYEDKPAPSGKRVLISGSRAASPYMLQAAADVVRQASAKGHEIIVGDAFGVDAAVVKAAKTYGVKLEVVGISERPRNVQAETVRYTRFEHPDWLPGTSAKERFHQRDRYMVDHADYCVFIWDGKSPGTEAAFRYAHQVGKQIFIKLIMGNLSHEGWITDPKKINEMRGKLVPLGRRT